MERRRIFRDIIIPLLAVTMVWSLIDVKCVKGDPDIDILIYIERRLYDQEEIRDAIDTYVADLQDEGWTNKTLVCNNVTEATPQGIRHDLATCCDYYPIKGCLLVGDFRYARWEDHVNGSSYPIDYYYMDLDGNWYDTDNDAVYDVHNGTIRPEIWVARLMASTIDDDVRTEEELYTDYFDKNNNTRSPSSRISHALPRALAYIDNEPAFGGRRSNESSREYDPIYVNDTVEALEKAYADVTLVSSPIPNATNTSPTDYEHRLTSTDGYEWVWLVVHGGTNFHAFGRYYWHDDFWCWGHGDDGFTDADYYLHNSPKSFFHIFSSSHAHRFDFTNSVSNAAVFGNGSGLASIAFGAPVPGSWLFESFEDLKQHECIGEAFKTVCNSIIDDHGGSEIEKSITLLGDPTLFLNQPPYTPSKPSGQESGYTNVEYTYFTNTTDLNGDSVQYQFEWGDETNTTTDWYPSGDTANASRTWYSAGTYNVTVRARDSYYPWSNWSLSLTVTIQNAAGCPFVNVWNGTDFVIDNNLLPNSANNGGTEVKDYYRLEQSLVPAYEGDNYALYPLRIGEFQQEHSYFDQVEFITVDHNSDINVAVSPFGEILTYQDPYAPVSAIDDQGNDQIELIQEIDDFYFEGYNGSYLLLNFGEVDGETAKLIMRADPPPKKQSIHIQVLDAFGNWTDVVAIIPRTYWATEIIDLSSYLPNSTEEFNVRLYFTDYHRVDLVGLDTTTQAEIDVEEAFLVLAYHSHDGFVTTKLLTDNNVYAELMPEQQITLLFSANAQSEGQRTFIICVKGYYITLDN